MNANYIYEYLPRTYTAKYEIYWGFCFLSSSEFQSILEKWLRQWTYDYWALLVYWNTSSKARVSLVSRADAIAFLWFLCFLLTPSTEALPLRPPSIRSIADLQPSEPNNYHLLIPGYLISAKFMSFLGWFHQRNYYSCSAMRSWSFMIDIGTFNNICTYIIYI